LIKAVILQGTAAAQGIAVMVANWAAAVLYNGLARYEEVAPAARKVTADAIDPWESMWALAELVEAPHVSVTPQLAHTARGPDRPARPGRLGEPRDRRPAVPQRAYRRMASGQGVYQALHQLPQAASRSLAGSSRVPSFESAEVGIAAEAGTGRCALLRRRSECEVLDRLLTDVVVQLSFARPRVLQAG
jgi:hypothetical protein